MRLRADARASLDRLRRITVPANSTLEILKNVRVDVNGSVQVTGTTLDETTVVQMPWEVLDGQGSFLINHAYLSRLMGVFTGEVEMDVNDDTVVFSSAGRTVRATLKSEVAEFPCRGEVTDKQTVDLHFTAAEMRSLHEQIAWACNRAKLGIAAIHLRSDGTDGTIIEATDGYCLAFCRRAAEFVPIEGQPGILIRDGVISALAGWEQPVAATISRSMAVFNVGTTVLDARAFEYRFPNTAGVIKKRPAAKVMVDARELLDMLAPFLASKVLADSNNSFVARTDIRVEGGRMEANAETNTTAGQGSIPVTGDHKIETKIDAQKLAQAVKAMGVKTVTLAQEDRNSPLWIEAVEPPCWDELATIVMPLTK